MFFNIVRYISKPSNVKQCHSLIVVRTLSKTPACYKNEDTTHFGFEQVSYDEKARRVQQVFTNVAEKYDVMNDAMSLGIHRVWKDMFIEHLNPQPGTRLLDVAGGTGDIALRFLNWVQGQGEVVVCDINPDMLEAGKQKAGLVTGITWKEGDAHKLPFSNNEFDAYTIAFGIRNCIHLDKVLSEAYRVLKPGGQFLCLEFSRVNNPLLSRLYDVYSFQVIPILGQVIARDWKSYQYLVESIRQFPSQDDFLEMIQNAGFKNVTYKNLTFGVSAIHSGFKI